jgi:hypothetical protein
MDRLTTVIVLVPRSMVTGIRIFRCNVVVYGRLRWYMTVYAHVHTVLFDQGSSSSSGNSLKYGGNMFSSSVETFEPCLLSFGAFEVRSLLLVRHIGTPYTKSMDERLDSNDTSSARLRMVLIEYVLFKFD